MALLKQAKSNFFLILFAIYYLIFDIPKVGAQTMSNDNYILQLEEADTSTDKPQAKDNTLGVSDQQIPKKPEPLYKIQTGFLHNKSKSPFTFSISSTVINFGTLFPTNPIKRSNKLTISNRSANGYSIIGFEDKELSSAVASDATSIPLSGASSDFIPDTTCDNGQCSESFSGPWTNPLTYGFGYRCDNVKGTDCASGLLDPNFYKQFANTSLSETPQKVAMATSAEKEKTIRITYKVNISSTQAKGSYSNTITYIAIPNF